MDVFLKSEKLLKRYKRNHNVLYFNTEKLLKAYHFSSQVTFDISH